MKVPLLPREKALRYVNYLHSRYGIPMEKMREWQFSHHGESISIQSKELPLLLRETINTYSAGLQAFTRATDFHPTSHFITVMGKDIHSNIVDIPTSLLDSFFQGKRIPREKVNTKNVPSNGFVAVRLDKTIIGSAELNANHLIPNLPFRTTEKRGADDE